MSEEPLAPATPDPARQRERGATAVEYGLIVALIAGVILVGVAMLGSTALDLFQRPTDEMTNQGL